MKLREKLILSFGGGAAAVLAVFGLIIYLTFAEALNENLENDFRLTLQASANALALSIEKQVYAIAPSVHPVYVPCADDPARECRSPAFHVHAPAIVSNDLFSLIDVLSWDGRQADVGAPTNPGISTPALLEKAKVAGLLTRRPLLLEDRGACYLLWPLFLFSDDHPDYVMIFLVSMSGLHELARSCTGPNNPDLVIFQDNRVLLAVTDSANNQFVDMSSAELINGMQESCGPTVARGHYYGICLPSDFLGWHIAQFIPKEVSRKSLVHLKDRVIVASLIMLWVTVWVILILANRITRPLIHLAKASEDIIAFDYETPLQFSTTHDEIGVLASNFEVMRRKIKDQVMRDPLTSTYNRRYLMHVLEIEMSRARRLGHVLGCLMVDLDHFKAINDTYGHHCGDKVLARLGEILTTMTRKHETPARFGGEEFIVLLAETNVEEAWQFAERLRQAILETVVVCDKQAVRVSASLGIAFFRPEVDATADAIIDRADKALYQAKHEGRNRTIIFREVDGLS